MLINASCVSVTLVGEHESSLITMLVSTMFVVGAF